MTFSWCNLLPATRGCQYYYYLFLLTRLAPHPGRYASFNLVFCDILLLFGAVRGVASQLSAFTVWIVSITRLKFLDSYSASQVSMQRPLHSFAWRYKIAPPQIKTNLCLSFHKPLDHVLSHLSHKTHFSIAPSVRSSSQPSNTRLLPTPKAKSTSSSS